MPKNSRRRNRRRNRNKKQPYGPLANPIVRGPERLLDGKTFTFKQYVPISSQILTGSPVAIEMNISPNGYEYKLNGPSGLILGQLWGEALQQFAPLALLYETYTVLEVSCEAVPSFPGLTYTVTPGVWAIQTAESRTNFIPPFDLATQVNATLHEPLKRSSRTLNYQPYLQQNNPESYLLTYDATTGGRQLFGVSTSATVTPLLTHYQEFIPQFSSGGDATPIITYLLTAKLHFRGRQNQVPTPTVIADLYQLNKPDPKSAEIGLPLLPDIESQPTAPSLQEAPIVAAALRTPTSERVKPQTATLGGFLGTMAKRA